MVARMIEEYDDDKDDEDNENEDDDYQWANEPVRIQNDVQTNQFNEVASQETQEINLDLL